MTGTSSNLDNFTRGSPKGDIREMYSEMCLLDYVKTWLTTFKTDTVKPSTYERLESSIKAMSTFPIARQRIKDITAFDIQIYVNDVADKGYSLSTIKKLLRIVTAPLRQAAALHFIPADPSAGVRLPTRDKIKKKTKETRPYTEAEQEKLWAMIESSNNVAGSVIGLMLETGLRCGEALALRWRCVDIQRKRLRVEATILNSATTGRSIIQESPKTVSSRRTVPLTPRAIKLLTSLQGKATSEWVFENEDGNRITYEALRWNTKKLCADAGVEYLGEHVFRHTFATNCYYKNVDVKILSRILGHADVNITYNIYISLRGDGFDEMYNALTGNATA